MAKYRSSLTSLSFGASTKAEEGDVISAVQTPSEKPRRLTYLLVGGDRPWREAMRSAFDQIGFLKESDSAKEEPAVCMQVDTPEEAVKVCVALHPDLVFISLTIGDSDARALARAIRQRDGGRHTGIVVYTTHVVAIEDCDPLTAAMLDAGIDDVVFASTSQEVMRARVRAAVRLKRMTDELRMANHRLKMLSLTDDLTGLANMRSFNTKFAHAVRRTRSGLQSMAVIMLDIDHFKKVNDKNNHLVGSACIRAIGQAIRATAALEDDDVVARYGGDEFILFVAADSLQEAEEKAEAIRRRIRETVVRFDEIVVKVTASVGVAFAAKSSRSSAEDLVKAADMMLYKSKEAGRDRVTSVDVEQTVETPSHQGVA